MDDVDSSNTLRIARSQVLREGEDVVYHVRKFAFRGIAKQIRAQMVNYHPDPSRTLDEEKGHVEELLLEELKARSNFKVYLTMLVKLVKLDAGNEVIEDIAQWFPAYPERVASKDDIQEWYSKSDSHILELIEGFIQNGSGWVVEEVYYFDINIVNVDITATRGRLPDDAAAALPSKLRPAIARKEACINVQGRMRVYGNDCFCKAVTVAAYIAACDDKSAYSGLAHRNRISTWERLWETRPPGRCDKPKFAVADLPMDISRVSRFERDNPKMKILVLADDGRQVFALKAPKIEVADEYVIVPLLLHEEHYYAVSSLNRLLNRDGQHLRDFCPRCLEGFRRDSTSSKFEAHLRFCNTQQQQRITMPKDGKNSTLSFQNYFKTMKVHFAVFADSESLLVPEAPPSSSLPLTNNSGRTRTPTYKNLNVHIPMAFSFLFWISPAMFARLKELQLLQNFPKMETNTLYFEFLHKDCVNQFMEKLLELSDTIVHVTKKLYTQIKWTPELHKRRKEVEQCELCHGNINNADENLQCVVHHCWITGRVLGYTHKSCNAKTYWKRKYLPVIFHNFKGYDCHSICKYMKLQNKREKIGLNVIAINYEKYKTLTVKWKVSEYVDRKTNKKRSSYFELKFIDSMEFLAASLESLTSTLEKGAFTNTESYLGDKSELLSRKGVFPYTYLDSWERLEERKLPPIEAFYNDLTNAALPEGDYTFAQTVWSEMKCETLRDYLRLYLKTDVLLLSDIFLEFRKVVFEDFALEVLHYESLPALSFDAALKQSRVEIDLLSDFSLYSLFERSIRGGLCFGTQRISTANCPELGEEYDGSKPTKYITVLDANSLYAMAMQQPLPVGNFKELQDVDQRFFERCPVSGWPGDDEETGYTLEVDLDYPAEIHDKTASYPLAPEKINVTREMLSKTMLEDFAASYENKRQPPAKDMKLLSCCENKRNYIVHYSLLKKYIQWGMKLRRVIAGVSYTQKPWLREYINFNIQKRRESKTNFESNLRKLCNNAIFGRTQMNKRGRKDVRLTASPQELLYHASRINYRGMNIINDELAALHMTKTNVLLNQPIFCGASILDLSKLQMYHLFYDILQPKFGPESVRLLYTDTDSLMLEISSENYWTEMREIAPTCFDGSNLPLDHPLHSTVNRAVPGLLKDEVAGAVVKEIVFVRPKMYSVLTSDPKQNKVKAKGLSKHIVKKQLRHEDYRRLLEVDHIRSFEVTQLRSIKHVVYTRRSRKQAMAIFENKRYWIDSNYSLPHFHKDIIHSSSSSSTSSTSSSSSSKRNRAATNHKPISSSKVRRQRKQQQEHTVVGRRMWQAKKRKNSSVLQRLWSRVPSPSAPLPPVQVSEECARAEEDVYVSSCPAPPPPAKRLKLKQSGAYYFLDSEAAVDHTC